MGFKDFVPAEQQGQVAATPDGASSGDDLFEFDENAAGQGEELDQKLSDAVVDTPASAQPAAALPKARRASEARSGSSQPAPSLLASALPPPEPPPPVKGPALPHAMLAVLMLLLIANVLTLVAGWKSQADVGGLLQRLGSRAVGDFEQVRQQTVDPARSSSVGSQPLAARPEGYQTLDVARRAIDQADFGRARRELFALQAVADRLDPSARDDVLAQAAFMIADAYRLQAESLTTASLEQRP